MAPKLARATSSASTVPPSRPQSSQSARSTDSNATQPIATSSAMENHFPYGFPGQIPWQNQQQQQQYQQQQQQQQYSHEEFRRRQQQQIQFQQGQPEIPSYAPSPITQNLIDAQQYNNFGGPVVQYAQPAFSFNQNLDTRPSRSPTLSTIGGEDLGLMQNDENGQGQTKRKKKGSGASQANDQELRRLLRLCEGRTLTDMAEDVKKEEKGPKAEKAKQVFGMMWLKENVKWSSESVPRSRVYAGYAGQCADDHLPVLNPASFGKLVRIIYPKLITRRLGVRGESRYHYVNLAMKMEAARSSVPPPPTAGFKIESGRDRTMSVQPDASAPPDKAFFPNLGSPLKLLRTPQSSSASTTRSSIILRMNLPDAGRILPSKADLMPRPLAWPNPETQPPSSTDIQLPSIEPYLPENADADVYMSLENVYRNHCVMAVDNFRFCKTDKLCDSFKTLVGLLTVPSQKLLENPKLAGWIEACDTLKYQKMVPLLQNILIMQIPEPAINHMYSVAHNLCFWITQFFTNQPSHVMDAMLRPASQFVSLLGRFIKVNKAARIAASHIQNQHICDEFWTLWVNGSQPLQVVEDVCSQERGGHHRLLCLLYQELRFVIQPSPAVAEKLATGFFAEELWIGKFPSACVRFKEREGNLETDATSGRFDRLVRFIDSLPSRFPLVRASEFLDRLDITINAATNNMTSNEAGAGFTTWMALSHFIREILYFRATLGGFIEGLSTASSPEPTYTSPYETISQNTELATVNKVTAPVVSFGSQGVQPDARARSKLSKMTCANSDPNEDAKNTDKGRISLGGETAVGSDEDDFPSLDGPMDWNISIKEADSIFNNQSSDNPNLGMD